MSQLEPVGEKEHSKSLWPVAAVILIVVFAPALVACVINLLRP
jgi:hypothetical protein